MTEQKKSLKEILSNLTMGQKVDLLTVDLTSLLQEWLDSFPDLLTVTCIFAWDSGENLPVGFALNREGHNLSSIKELTQTQKQILSMLAWLNGNLGSVLKKVDEEIERREQEVRRIHVETERQIEAKAVQERLSQSYASPGG